MNTSFTKIEDTPLSQIFFSKSNINILQNQIINKVYKLSNGEYKIGNQDEMQLFIIMRGIYLKYGLNQNNNIHTQVQVLNNNLLNYILPNLLSNIKQAKQNLRFIPKLFKKLPLFTLKTFQS